MAVVTPTDRPKSFRNRCVFEVFGGVLCFHFSVGVWGFCHRTESDLFLFILLLVHFLKNHTKGSISVNILNNIS